MAKNVDEGASKKINRTPDAATLEKIASAQDRMDRKNADARGEFGRLVDDATKTKNYHAKAGKCVNGWRKLGARDPAALAELLYHVDTYRKLLKIDDLCTPDMLRKAEADDAKAKPAAAKVAKGAKLKDKGKSKAKKGSDNVVQLPKRKGASGEDIAKADVGTAPTPTLQ